MRALALAVYDEILTGAANTIMVVSGIDADIFHAAETPET